MATSEDKSLALELQTAKTQLESQLESLLNMKVDRLTEPIEIDLTQEAEDYKHRLDESLIDDVKSLADDFHNRPAVRRARRGSRTPGAIRCRCRRRAATAASPGRCATAASPSTYRTTTGRTNAQPGSRDSVTRRPKGRSGAGLTFVVHDAMIDRLRSLLGKMNASHVPQQQREAMLDLLIWTMYADRRLALPENDSLDEMAGDMKWSAVTPVSQYMNHSFARIREVLDDPDEAEPR